MAVQKANYVWRDYEMDGVSASGNHKPILRDLRTWGTYVETAVTGAGAGSTIYDSKADMTADTSQAANAMAWVLGDDIAANNGVYQFDGTSTWTRLGDLPYSVVYAQNAGAGSANAVKVTTDLPISSAAYSQLVSVPFVASNTGAMTLAINNDGARALVTNTGDAIPSGYVQAGMSALVQIDGYGKFRLFSYGDASSIQAAAEAAQTAAEAAKVDAEAAAASLGSFQLVFFANDPNDVRSATLGSNVLFVVVQDATGTSSIYAYKTGTNEADTVDDVLVSADGRRYVRSVAGVKPTALGRTLLSANSPLEVQMALGMNNRRYDYSSAGTYKMDPEGYTPNAAHYVSNSSGVVKIDIANIITYFDYVIYTDRSASLELDTGADSAIIGSVAPSFATAPTSVSVGSNKRVTVCRLGGNRYFISVDSLDEAWTVSATSKYRMQSDGLFEFIHTRAASAISAGATTTAGCAIVAGFDLSGAAVLSCTPQPASGGGLLADYPPQVVKLGTTHSLAANAFAIGNPNAGVMSTAIVTHFVNVAKA